MKILVPIDFSDFSINAFNYAVDLAKDFSGEVVLFHAAHNKITSDLNSMISVDDILLKEANDQLVNLIKTKENTGVKITYFSKIGLANDLIVSFCKELKVDLIVMGTKGATGINKMLFGSVTSSLIRKCKIPLLAIPINASYNSIKNITLALDLKNEIKSIDLIAQIASLRNAEVNILNIKKEHSKGELEDKTIVFIEEKLGKTKHSYNFIENNNIIEGIENFISKSKTNLLAVISKKHNFIERLFHKSVSEALAIDISSPLLIIK